MDLLHCVMVAAAVGTFRIFIMRPRLPTYQQNINDERARGFMKICNSKARGGTNVLYLVELYAGFGIGEQNK